MSTAFMYKNNTTIHRYLIVFLFAVFNVSFAGAQEFGEVFGKVTDIKNQPLGLVNIAVSGLPGAPLPSLTEPII